MRALFTALFGLAAAAASGCVQKNASHCANLAGDATCAERGGAPLCSKCTSENDGCVGTVEVECAVGVGSETTAVGTSETTSSASATSTTSHVTSSSTTEPTTDQTSETPGPDVLPFCGDGQVNTGDEFCDGMDLNGFTCEGLGFVAGELKCAEDCDFDLELCQGQPPCPDGMIGEGEDCDGEMLDGATCESLRGPGFEGEVTCHPLVCVYDVSDCCKPEGVQCDASQDECCEGLTCKVTLENLKLFSCLP